MAPAKGKKAARKAEPAQPAVVPSPGKKASPSVSGSVSASASASAPPASESEASYHWAAVVLTVLAFATRFYRIDHPDSVVFDEVHFGKFASYYLQRTYFFDLHPPMAKMLIALVGWLIGYDGDFKFESIGDNYIRNKVPYLAYRSLEALQGTLTVPIVFYTMKESGFGLAASVLAASIVLFDNAHIAETRLILLDATLVISVAASVYCYVRFSRQRNAPFSRGWWLWLAATGVALSCVISTKYVGVFTFGMVGIAVVVDLWRLLDLSAGLSMRVYVKQFAARFYLLILLPFVLYLGWFYLHFSVLSRSGPGDAFMSLGFQETLGDSMLAREAKPVHYFDTVLLKHKETGAYLHSHLFHYPLRYDDGRVSSQGQQVTAVKYPEGTDPLEDVDSQWEILPATDDAFPPEKRAGHPVRIDDRIRLRHVGTGCYLLAHDVASPSYPTNEEFTCVDEEKALGARYGDTLFDVRPSAKKDGGVLKTKGVNFRLTHTATKVAMWSDAKPLPEWAFGQQEVNGKKLQKDSANLWTVDAIVGLSDNRVNYTPKQVKHLPFMSKWAELQRAMFEHNNKLSKDHPYASRPAIWPLSLKGVSFWTDESTKSQIYFIGNFVGYFVEATLLPVYVLCVAADQLLRKRGIELFRPEARNKLYNTIGFFFLGWCVHYFPFFLMGRQLFLHHYLSAHLIAAMFAGGMVEFLFANKFNSAGLDILAGISSQRGPMKLSSVVAYGPRRGARKQLTFGWENRAAYHVFVALLIAALIACFLYFAPLTYGLPLTPEQVVARQWFGVSLHFAKQN